MRTLEEFFKACEHKLALLLPHRHIKITERGVYMNSILLLPFNENTIESIKSDINLYSPVGAFDDTVNMVVETVYYKIYGVFPMGEEYGTYS
jgi:hypothetical protein